jgi:UDP-N-acetylglucosamine 4,6-dehydratase
MLNKKTLLVTGGTGSFGKKFIKAVLTKYPDIKKVIVFSRDELKQFDMANEDFFQKHDDKMRFFIGDVRDVDRLKRATEGVDFIVHAAALKQVPAAEYNPYEFIKTNVLGAQNIVEASLSSGVKKVVALSTDKACAPINLYGATKLCSDKLFTAANNMKGSRDITFSVVRYGNVLGSRGSVLPYFFKMKKLGYLPITDEKMTRFNITLDQGVEMVIYSLENMWGGEIFIPKIPSYKIGVMAEAVCPSCEKRIVGIRPGEKLHEEMITSSDSLNTVDCGKYYVILPSAPAWDVSAFKKHFNAALVGDGFEYNSGTNEDWITVDEMRGLIKTHYDQNFEV